MPYVNHRWLGGTLTNWSTIRKRIDTLKSLEKRRDAGEFNLLTKKEALILERKIDKLQTRLGGIRDMRRLPEMLVIVDTQREATAIKEANILGIPVLAVADTNSDPDDLDYIIPANDDAVRAIKLLVSTLADAAAEGRAMRKADDMGEEEELADAPAYYYEEGEEEVGDEQYLGAKTLAKLRDATLFGDEEAADVLEGETRDEEQA
jgi:small subunit ribosomal protein S2